MYIDAGFWTNLAAISDFLYLAWFVGKWVFFIIDPQNYFVQNQQILSVFWARVLPPQIQLSAARYK